MAAVTTTASASTSTAELLQQVSSLAAAAAVGCDSLADVVVQLEALCSQLRQACSMTGTEVAGTSAELQIPEQRPHKKQRKGKAEQRGFDFSRYRTRYIALELMYVGWSYQGFARQEGTENTIEGALFAALRKVKLIPEDRPIQELRYSRCGRTDKGVSALGQVIALEVRSLAKVDEPEASLEREYDYPHLLNRVLPQEIRILGWTPAAEDFHARFSARYREYKYFIVQQQQQQQRQQEPEGACTSSSGAGHAAGDGGPPRQALLDIAAMREAAAHLVGEHDFRNFCKPDVLAVKSFRRRIMSFVIEPVGTLPGLGVAHEVYAMTIRGTAFLWHQVRCMAAVLLMVGQGLEEPAITARLLDIAATPCKPQYSMAPEEPLLLYACGFEGLSFRRSERAVAAMLADLGVLMHRHLIGAALTAACYARAGADASVEQHQQTGDEGGSKSAVSSGRGQGHIPLLRRQTEPSIEDRMARHGVSWPAEGEVAPGPDGDGEQGLMVE